ncbi:MAG: helix-turn-helix domain-containing protein [Clostridia bacterium]|nr:helix-turn-helix domain-containing protein [Clostridia bacterium]
MPLFENPFSLQIPVQSGYLNTTFFINQNLYVVSTECQSTPHNHHDFELRYIATGDCNQLIANEVYSACAGDLLIVHPHEYHCQTQDHVKKASTQYNLRFSPELPCTKNPAVLNAYKSFMDYISAIRQIHDDSGVLNSYFHLLTNEIYQKRPGYIGSIKALCSLILTELIRFADADMQKLYPADELEYHGYGRAKIDSFFRSRYLTDIKIQDLADDMRVSTRQVNYIMHKMFGMSFTQKINEMRLQQAALQLAYTDNPIAQICKSCGFQNQNYFSICFRKSYSMSPSEYRVYTRKNLGLKTNKIPPKEPPTE